MGKISDSHAELMHYTSAAGLDGILASRSIRATGTRYLNDDEEIVGFYNRILPKIVRPIFENYILSVEDEPQFQRQLLGQTKEVMINQAFDGFIDTLRKVTADFHDHFVTCFSTTKDPHILNDGLLSQWRGYGSDGGYAIIFDSAGLDRIMDQETLNFDKDTYSWADIQYELGANGRTGDSDVNEWIEKLESAAKIYLETKQSDDLLRPLSVLSSFFKHRGFSEEKEVRFIIQMLSTGLVAVDGEMLVSDHVVKTFIRNGTTVPYVETCIAQKIGPRLHLPIRKVIVGPHREKMERKRAVELLFKQYGLNAEVGVSDIPFRGR